jgi:hypothetical protein
MAVGPTYIDGLTGNITELGDLVENAPVSIGTADAATILAALVTLGLATDDT